MILTSTDPLWGPMAAGQIDRVLVDHAHCEKKAASQALALLSAYPERERLVRELSALAIEELGHFRSVLVQLRRRGLGLGRDFGDPYAQSLHGLARRGSGRLLDRLLIAGLIEARSSERLDLLGRALGTSDLAGFYTRLARAEVGHAELFRALAARYAPDEVSARLTELARAEAEIVSALPLEPRIH